MSENNKTEDQLLPCSFQFHEFVSQVGEVKLACHIIKMKDSFYLWIGEFAENAMNDLSVSLVSQYENKDVPIATKIMGSVADTASGNIAKRLSKKTGKPVYVSFNLQVDNLSLPSIERRIHEEFNNCTELLTF